MTTFPSDMPPTSRLSKSSLTSLICGILGCIPFLTGLLAVLFGIIGCIRTSDPLKRGRWMAITGLILGVISLIAWSGAALVGGGVFAFLKATAPVRTTAHDFIQDVAKGDDAAAKDLTDGISDNDYNAIAKSIRDKGTFIDTTFFATTVTNDSAHVEGVATFDAGSGRRGVPVRSQLQNIAGHWKIKDINVSR